MPKVYNKNAGDYPAGAVDVSRGTPWGNPFRIGEHGTREEVIRRFECEILPTLDVSQLEGRDLLCSCAPKPCHAYSIMRKANL